MRKLYYLRLFFFLLALAVVACGADKKPAFQEIPGYPGAKHIVLEEEVGWLRKETFQTPASIEDVRSFYKTELLRHGWQFEGESGSFLGYLFPNRAPSESHTLRLRIAFSIEQDSHETIVFFDQMVMKRGVSMGITP